MMAMRRPRRGRRRRAACLALLIPLAALSGVAAQTAGSAGTAPPAGARLRTAVPPYEAELLRLAEILGAIHFLDSLCGYSDTPPWREEMLKLIEAEKPSTHRRAALINAFNRGFRQFAQIYRRCTTPARLLRGRYVAEGATISTTITRRYSLPTNEEDTPAAENPGASATTSETER